MAYDPEARRDSKSALIIGLVGLLALGGLAMAYFATRHEPETPAPVIINSSPRPSQPSVINNVPVAVPGPTQIVVVQATPMAQTTVKTVERNTVITHDRMITPQPAIGSNSTSSTNPGTVNSTTNVTINPGATPGSSTSSSTTSSSGGETGGSAKMAGGGSTGKMAGNAANSASAPPTTSTTTSGSGSRTDGY